MPTAPRKPLKRTWLHALLRVEPGHFPHWLLSSSGCGPDACGVISLALSGGITAAALIATVSATGHERNLTGVRSWLAAALVLAICGFVAIEWLVVEPVRTAERKARAARRRESRQV